MNTWCDEMLFESVLRYSLLGYAISYFRLQGDTVLALATILGPWRNAYYAHK